MYQDTIVAISTPLGEGGIGIVRLSGGEARSIVEKLFDKPLADRRLVYGHISDPENGEVIDEALVAFMAAPHTFTREDIVEINCHGGSTPLQSVLGLSLRYGARLAQPGEFTLRAFLNGRIDLSQAEAVLDIIQAKTEAGLRLAVQGLKGRLSGQIRLIRERLIGVLAYLTARIDFPEDEVEEQDTIEPIEAALDDLQRLIDGADAGMIYRNGIRTAIVGRPNVGKSSLLNRLLRENRAIVTAIPGTTRDTLEETVNLRGVPFLLVDTAGIVDSHDAIESLGVERSRRAIAQADLILLVIDASQPLSNADREVIALLSDKMVLVVANKCDLPSQADLGDLLWETAFVSALSGEGLERLEEKMAEIALGGRVIGSDACLVTSVRHKEALGRARRHLCGARQNIEAGMPDDFATIELNAALQSLGEITGEAVTDDLLEAIFSRFCIGK